VVDEQVGLRFGARLVGVPAEVGDALGGQHVLAQERVPVQSRLGLVITSIPPNHATACATAAATWSASRISPTTGSAWPPAASICAAAVNTVPSSLGCGSAVLAISATLATSRAARSAIARPMPRLPPEMN